MNPVANDDDNNINNSDDNPSKYKINLFPGFISKFYQF